jgi:hypothetical protein
MTAIEREVRTKLRNEITAEVSRLAKEGNTAPWIMRYLRARTPDLATLGARNVLRSPEHRDYNIRDAVQSYRDLLQTYQAVHRRTQVDMLVHSASWRRSLPCCSKAPIWPLCRAGC